MLVIQPCAVAQIFHGRQLVIQHGSVAEIADGTPHRASLCAAKNATNAETRPDQSSDKPQQSGFASAVLPQNDVALSRGEFRRNFTQRREAAVQLGDFFEMHSVSGVRH